MRQLTLIIILFAIGCNTAPKELAPKTVQELREDTYKFKDKYWVHKYDCSNMSYDLSKLLNNKGYQTAIYCYKIGFTYHAIVRVNINNKYYYLDPARGKTFLIPSGKPVLVIHDIDTALTFDLKKDFKSHLTKN